MKMEMIMEMKMKINPILSYTVIEAIFNNHYDEYDFSTITETEQYKNYQCDYMKELYYDASTLKSTLHLNALLNIQQHIHDGSLDKEILRCFIRSKS